jgi:hypothetical protein
LTRAAFTLIGLLSLTATIPGCGGDAGPELVPVAGRVSIDGKPATEGVVTYRHASGNTFEASGLIQPDGRYKLMQRDREGAQVGAYRVVVFVRKTPRTSTGEMAGLPTILVNKRFTDPKTTPLSVEVKADVPDGYYDLAVTR